MSRLQTIENALTSINETVFQELCDSYLAIRNENYSALSRTGSMSGKQKTTVGTPDSLLLLPNGKYLFVECSTNITKGVTKLKEDVQKCLDTKKTGIKVNEILEIILCINFNLVAKEIEELRQLLAETRIRLTIISLDSLAIELHLSHRDLAHHYLGLPLDSGQIVSLEQFVKEYNKASNYIATPLDNVFIQREKELQQLKNSLLQSDFIILTGAPGVGKTKLVIETIQSFLKDNQDYNAYCISYKNYALLDDLYQYLNVNKNYILFVDDANRIDAFNQITGFYKADRNGKLKIIITVRDYAYQEIGRLCQEFGPVRIDLAKLNDEAITDIIKSDSFEILNSQYQKEIIKIADGNPRLAIMASLLAKAHQDLAVLHDVSDLFEKYFSTFVKDQKEFVEDVNLKCLGLIGFFYTLPYKDRETMGMILKDFDIEYAVFLDTIDQLDKLELVEIQFEHVKIPEQNLSLYFFYKAFIKDNLLGFQVLLNKYFESNKNRFKECVISANNTFGPQNVMNKLKPDLVGYWNSINTDPQKAFSFLNIFWFYLRLETFDFLIYEIDKLPEIASDEYVVIYKNNAFAYNQDQILELLSEYFRVMDVLSDALSLAFRYVQKQPHHLPELVQKIIANLLFDWRDERYGFNRQHMLFDFLLKSLPSNVLLFTTVFFELSKTFLKYKFQHTEGGRNHSFSLYFYPIPNNASIQQFRKKILVGINNYFELNPSKGLEVLESYATVNPDVESEIMAFDLPFLIHVIESNLTNESFEHCRYVHNQIRWCKRMNVESAEFDKLEGYFTNSLYEIFLKIDWNRIRDKEMFEFGNHRDYEKLKEEEIRHSFIFDSVVEIERFYQDFVHLKALAKNEWNYNTSLEIIIDENLNRNFEIGRQFYVLIIRTNNSINYVPRLSFKQHLVNDYQISTIWQLMASNQFHSKTAWELSFFDLIDESKIVEEQVDDLIKTIESINEPLILHFDGIAKYLRLAPDLFKKVLRIVTLKNDEKIGIRLWMDFFSSHLDQLGDDLELIKKAYIQQFVLQDYFDYELAAFDMILNKDANFLLEFIKTLYVDREFGYRDGHRSFKAIWKVDGIEPALWEIFELFAEKNDYYGILPIYLNTFFRNLDNGIIAKADKFLIDYLKANAHDPVRINLIVDIVRHERKELFDRVLLEYVSVNKNVSDFKKIWWRGNGGSYTGDVIMGDLEAADWRNILKIVERSDIGVDLVPIKKYILSEESYALKQGDWERKRRFLERD